jgi:pimeloyl-ACP methyl ester carboxylesterase
LSNHLHVGAWPQRLVDLFPPDPHKLAKGVVRVLVTLLYACIVLSISFPTRPVVAGAYAVIVAWLFTYLWFGSGSWRRLLTFLGLPFVIFILAQLGARAVTRTGPEQVEADFDDAREVGEGQGVAGPVPFRPDGGDRALLAFQKADRLPKRAVEPPRTNTLVVLVHGAGGPDSLKPLRRALHGQKVQSADWSALDAPDTPPSIAIGADVIPVRFPDSWWGWLSNTDPVDIATGIHQQIKKKFAQKSYARVVIVGHSMGALLARKAYLIGRKEATDDRDHWTKKVRRFVLLAGMNRGWSISGPRPLDLGSLHYAFYWTLASFARRTDTGGFALQMETGAPFVANLRLEWMRLARQLRRQMPQTVQLLGDIDDVVTDEDNTDLRVSGAGGFCWLRVRGTGHSDIVEVSAEGVQYRGSDREDLARYRFEKLFQALTKPFDELQRVHDLQRVEEDPCVTRVIFVLHGIRDLGRWSVRFEQALDEAEQARRRAQPKDATAESDERSRIVSPRYGYFGMGPFLLPEKRETYVRWFMDEYTETLAAYPRLKQIDFFGHSNGTYLLAKGLENYSSLQVHRIVFAGSVVRRDYPWGDRFKQDQVKAVRHYVATDDWVVALFPCFFEKEPMRRLGNKIGSAGFNGFAPPDGVPQDVVYGTPLGTAGAPPVALTGEIVGIEGDQITIEQPSGSGRRTLEKAHFVQNVGRVEGDHSAFLKHVGAIEKFLSEENQVPRTVASEDAWWHPVLQFVSDRLIWLVWLFLLVVIVAVGYALTVPAQATLFINWVLTVSLPDKPNRPHPGGQSAWVRDWFLFLFVGLPWSVVRYCLWYPLLWTSIVLAKYAVIVGFTGPRIRAIAVVCLFMWLLDTI